MKLKSTIVALAVMAFASIASAQTNFIRGTMNINFVTHQNPPNTPGIQDLYDINLNVANSIGFHGKITDRPQLSKGWITKEVYQPRSVKYNVSCDLINPKNPSQVIKNISELKGFVNIAPSGEYNYSGGLGFSVLNQKIAGSDSKFSGVAAGKPLNRPVGWMDSLQLQTINITRSVNGQTRTVALKKYDKMEFRSLVLAVGPVPFYTDATCNGEMLYDYDKNTWFFNNVNVSYAVPQANGTSSIQNDRFTGTIRWVEDENRKSNGKGEYQFDIRVNEPIVGDAFSGNATASPGDESSFFASDANVYPGLTGTMKYQDTIKNDVTMSSAVTIDLTGNNISKQQLMILNKMIIFISVVPMNAD